MHKEGTVVREVSITEHYEVISRMMQALHEHEYTLFDKTASWKDIESDYMHHLVTMQQEQGGVFLMAYRSDMPVGFIFGYLEDQDESRIEVYTGKQLYVSDGYVVPECRRQGVYHLLNEHIEHHYVSQGVKRIIRFTLVRNTGMRQFLDSKGYFVSRLLYEKWL